MRVHYNEEVAIHIGPEPCAGAREGVGEASVGDGTGQPLSHEIGIFSGADALLLAEDARSASPRRRHGSDRR